MAASFLTPGTDRSFRGRALILLLVIAAAHAVGFGLLLGVVVPEHYALGGTVFGVGLGLTAYTYGIRHAFDADHIAAIDNTTRKLRADGRRSTSVGFWFAMGHSSTVFVLAALVGGGVHVVHTLVDDSSRTNHLLGTVSLLASGGFLYLIALLNLSALAGIWRTFQRLRAGSGGAATGDHLDIDLVPGPVGRLLGRLNRAITRPWQMYTVGLLFGLGFDTATEVALLVLAGTGVAAGVPWWVVMVLPLLFAAGMTLFDALDGLFMSAAYDWAFVHPVRKVYYNLSVTTLSVSVALIIGSVQMAAVLHDELGWDLPVVTAISGIPLEYVGYLTVGLFLLVWAIAISYWRLARVEERWALDADAG